MNIYYEKKCNVMDFITVRGVKHKVLTNVTVLFWLEIERGLMLRIQTAAQPTCSFVVLPRATSTI